MDSLYLVLTALAFNCVDMISGLISAIKNKEVQSTKLRDGLFKKVGFLFCYLLAYMIDASGTFIGFDIGVTLLPIIVAYVVLTEIVSIIENIAAINPDLLPDKLLSLFHITDLKDGENK